MLTALETSFKVMCNDQCLRVSTLVQGILFVTDKKRL